jgi:tetratricopeptide (TPR) repeat protein
MLVVKTVLAACFVLLIQNRAALAQPLARTAAASHVGKAIRLMEERLFNEAATEFEQALAADPDNDAVRIQYATCLFAQERDEEARTQFEIERQRLGNRPGLNYYLGRLDLRANQFASAIKRLAPLEHDPALSKVSYYLGLAYMSAGQEKQALECLERAARDNPSDPEVHYRLGRLYSMAGRMNDADREYKLYTDWQESRRIVERDGRDCKDALRTQPIARARLVCQPVADPKDSRRLILLGELYSENGAFGDALEPLEQAVRLEPESFEAWNSLGLSLFRLKRYQQALPPLRKASSLNPQFFGTLTLLASTLHMLGDDMAALPVLERAHNLNPEDAQVTAALEQIRGKTKGKR